MEVLQVWSLKTGNLSLCKSLTSFKACIHLPGRDFRTEITPSPENAWKNMNRIRHISCDNESSRAIAYQSYPSSPDVC